MPTIEPTIEQSHNLLRFWHRISPWNNFIDSALQFRPSHLHRAADMRPTSALACPSPLHPFHRIEYLLLRSSEEPYTISSWNIHMQHRIEQSKSTRRMCQLDSSMKQEQSCFEDGRLNARICRTFEECPNQPSTRPVRRWRSSKYTSKEARTSARFAGLESEYCDAPSQSSPHIPMTVWLPLIWQPWSLDSVPIRMHQSLNESTKLCSKASNSHSRPRWRRSSAARKWPITSNALVIPNRQRSHWHNSFNWFVHCLCTFIILHWNLILVTLSTKQWIMLTRMKFMSFLIGNSMSWLTEAQKNIRNHFSTESNNQFWGSALCGLIPRRKKSTRNTLIRYPTACRILLGRPSIS